MDAGKIVGQPRHGSDALELVFQQHIMTINFPQQDLQMTVASTVHGIQDSSVGEGQSFRVVGVGDGLMNITSSTSIVVAGVFFFSLLLLFLAFRMTVASSSCGRGRRTFLLFLLVVVGSAAAVVVVMDTAERAPRLPAGGRCSGHRDGGLCWLLW